MGPYVLFLLDARVAISVRISGPRSHPWSGPAIEPRGVYSSVSWGWGGVSYEVRSATMTPSRVGTMVETYPSSLAIIALCSLIAAVQPALGSSGHSSTTRPDHSTLSQR